MGNINGHETTITASWLRMRLAEPETAQRICLIDATPTMDAPCLPYARPLDVCALAACGVPTADAFQAAVRSIGATSLDQVVIEDTWTVSGLFGACSRRSVIGTPASWMGGIKHGAASAANSRPAIRPTTSEPGGRNAYRHLASSWPKCAGYSNFIATDEYGALRRPSFRLHPIFKERIGEVLFVRI